MYTMFSIFSQSVSTLTLEADGHIDKDKLDRFLQTLLWEKNICNSQGETIEILRLKVGNTCYMYIVMEKNEQDFKTVW